MSLSGVRKALAVLHDAFTCVSNMLEHIEETTACRNGAVECGDSCRQRIALPGCAIEAHEDRIGICELCAP